MADEAPGEVLAGLAACAAAGSVDALLTAATAVLRALGGETVQVAVDPAGELVVTGGPAPRTAVAVVRGALARLRAEQALADLAGRVDTAQQLANMGDYDWHIATDTNRWSDQLYRIYGHEPQAFNASYERFIGFLHPDDRERIAAIHRRAYETGAPYQMIERIVRPDGETRYLASNGQVLRDATGTPVRMRGTCIDITDRVLAEQERERSAARFRALVEAGPDAVLVVEDGVVVQANGRAGQLLGGDPVGRPVTALLADGGADEASGVPATGLDGRRLRLDVVPAALADAARAVFLRDAGPRLAGEAAAAQLREVQVRRRQALEMNDNVVQELTAAGFALEVADEPAATSYLDRALSGARQLMNDWLTPADGRELAAGDLVRSGAAGPAPAPPAPEPPPRPRAVPRIVLVDDNADVRLLTRLQIERLGGFEVVGEAADGARAVELVAALQPDVVFLDLAMPVMDGLQALPLIRQRAPAARVVVLSGFDEATLGARALAAGAARYVQKGVGLDFRRIIEELLPVPPEG